MIKNTYTIEKVTTFEERPWITTEGCAEYRLMSPELVNLLRPMIGKNDRRDNNTSIRIATVTTWFEKDGKVRWQAIVGKWEHDENGKPILNIYDTVEEAEEKCENCIRDFYDGNINIR